MLALPLTLPSTPTHGERSPAPTALPLPPRPPRCCALHRPRGESAQLPSSSAELGQLPSSSAELGPSDRLISPRHGERRGEAELGRNLGELEREFHAPSVMWMCSRRTSATFMCISTFSWASSLIRTSRSVCPPSKKSTYAFNAAIRLRATRSLSTASAFSFRALAA